MTPNHTLNKLRSLPYFAGLNPVYLDMLAEMAFCQSLSNGEHLFHESETAVSFFAVTAGRVQIYKISSDGKEFILHLFGAGEIFAEVPVFNHIPRYPASAKALGETEVLGINGEQFLALVHEYPDILLSMMSVFARRLHEFSGLIEDLSLRSVVGRLAKYLLEVSNQTHTVTLDINKKVLAGILGTIPETLSRSFRKLQNEALIAVSTHRVAILDREGLNRIAQLPEESAPLIRVD